MRSAMGLLLAIVIIQASTAAELAAQMPGCLPPPPPPPFTGPVGGGNPNFRALGGVDVITAGPERRPVGPGPFDSTTRIVPLASPNGAGGRPVAGVTAPRGLRKADVERLLTWQAWWDLNDERFLDRRRAGRTPSTSSPGHTSLPGGDVLAPDMREALSKAAVPALLLALEDKSADVRAAAALALGKASDHSNAAAFDALKGLLADRDQRVRGAASLGLGLLGRSDGASALLSIAQNNDKGRQLTGRGTADVLATTRGYAALGVGLIAYRGELPVDIGRALLELATDVRVPRDVTAGAALALQLIGRQDFVPEVLKVIADDNFDDITRSHLVVALAKVEARSASGAYKRGLSDPSTLVGYSSAIALGLITDVEDITTVDLLIKEALDSHDLATRVFATLSLAEIGGAPARTAILKRLMTSKVAEEKAFAALAVGVTGRMHGEEVNFLGRSLLSAMEGEKNDSVLAAAAMGLGLLRYEPARDVLRPMLKETGRPELQGYAAVALGLLRDDASTAAIGELLVQRRDAPLRERAALALGLMSDPSAHAAVAEAVRASASAKTFLNASLLGLGYLGHVSSVDVLSDVALNKKSSHTDATRVAAVTALGVLADKDDIPLLSRVQGSSNYLAQTTLLADLFRLQ